MGKRTNLELRSNGKDKFAIVGEKETILLIWDMVKLAMDGIEEDVDE